jgi:hypothetical protein
VLGGGDADAVVGHLEPDLVARAAGADLDAPALAEYLMALSTRLASAWARRRRSMRNSGDRARRHLDLEAGWVNGCRKASRTSWTTGSRGRLMSA